MFNILSSKNKMEECLNCDASCTNCIGCKSLQHCHYCVWSGKSSWCHYCHEINYSRDSFYCNNSAYINNCHYCDWCTFCEGNFYCRNLKFTRNNIFCYYIDGYTSQGKDFKKGVSFQGKEFRIFNKEVTEDEFRKVMTTLHSLTRFDAWVYHLEFNYNDSYSGRFQTAFLKMWKKLSMDEKQVFYSIPHFNWEWFSFITWVSKE